MSRRLYAREATIRWNTKKDAGPMPAKLAQPAAAAEYLRKVLPLDDPREHFAVIALSTKHEPLGYFVSAIGTANAALVHPAEIFRFALLAHGVSVIVAHTHPSGDPTPSADDIALTRRLVDAGQILGIGVIEHIILGCETRPGIAPAWLSLRELHPATFRA